jgi:hypothetical protein
MFSLTLALVLISIKEIGITSIHKVDAMAITSHERNSVLEHSRSLNWLNNKKVQYVPAPNKYNVIINSKIFLDILILLIMPIKFKSRNSID